ncbi:MAG TPA: thiamine pyrophosphate-binding protein, partial [Burkholderiaceae bacterium]|nr:thiamine pyrophosphate-binding protein [Burkholderiaceae bacterium]
ARSARRGGPRPVVSRHEAGAAFAADGYARETGKLGVCITTSGPGATNLITGVACAYDNSVPILAITGQPALPSFGKRALQESSCTGVNTVGMFQHCTRYNSLVSHADQVEHKLVNAVLRAHHTPQGPAHLSIPVDILRSPLERSERAYDLAALLRDKAALIDKRAVDHLQQELARAARKVFFIGPSCGEAIDVIMALVEATDAEFITSPDAKGLINPRHHAFRGVFGFGGHASAEAVLRSRPDLVVAFGTGFGELSSSGWCSSMLNRNLVHVDSCEQNLMRSPMARLHVRGDLRQVCERLLRRMPAPAAARDNVFNIADVRPDACNPAVALQEPVKFHSDDAPIKPQRLMKELSLRCPPNTRFLADTGNSMIWAVHYLQPFNRRAGRRPAADGPATPERRSGTANWLRTTMDFAPMGWAIGAAIGIARGNPNNPVVCITGDGSYLMSGQEITTAVQEQLPVVFVILNDSAYGMVMHGQRLAGAEPIAYELPGVDYALMAEAVGADGYIVEKPADLDALDFEAILSHNGPSVIDVRIDREEVPPMILRLKTLGSVKK